MRNIRLMDKALAEKIAAGEVVERPGSIVKELCENSIDAGSSAITIDIRNGGISSIRITDNGSGIPADEVALAFVRHSTSKMYTLEELENIAFLGFRGEALASIAAVSELKMVTRTKHSDVGVSIEIAGGETVSLHEVGCPYGTDITVENLFFNTPARRKFLKKPSSEGAYIGDIVSRLILAYPSISIKFVQDGRVVLHSPGNGRLEDAVMSVYGRDVSNNMLPVNCEKDGIKISGLISNSQLEKNNKSYQSLFINGRYVKDRIVAAAVMNGYVNNLTIGKFPMFVLFLQMDGSMVDVNVHPNKLEVRFSNEKLIYDTVTNAIYQALAVKNEIPALIVEETKKAPELTPYKVVKNDAESINIVSRSGDQKMEQKQESAVRGISESLKPSEQTPPKIAAAESVVSAYSFQPIVNKPVQANLNMSKFSDEQTSEADKVAIGKVDLFVKPVGDMQTQRKETNNEIRTDTNKENAGAEQMSLAHYATDDKKDIFANYRMIGQVFATYVIVESDDTVYLIDQHAAHERLLYERLVKSFENGTPMVQTLLTPQMLKLNFTERERFISITEELNALGYEFDEFGDVGYVVRSVPVLMGRPCGIELIQSILSDFDHLRNCRAVDIKRQRLMQMACKHAIKAGDRLTNEELEAVMDMIRVEKVPLSCPHGRPILVSLTKKELELRFKRIQS